jgi:hypothetical protein
MKNDLQLALDTAERAKEEDKKKNYPKSFLLYRRALDYFVKVLNSDLNQYTRQSLNKTVKVYVVRAEKLKEFESVPALLSLRYPYPCLFVF